ncbi:uncharacterized protein BYT42DRAFT_13414 [Radiomyces spectabilis]|uniref:uncharacterized protein n=1 Tax=Radiomyces spectabilis TaxID=64574 RepID=UPI00221E4BDA|nr:uncharacterized protein BYT42DRAFT_13414 [Radiomyces spectabilis]KAI8393623.1 hypothetical protein BYT42DRAFT_13414 [Radiomyces spectabilis]
MSSLVSWESQLTPQERHVYAQLFKKASQSKPGIVTGTEAVRFFASSGVPNEILSEIWETADRDNVGYLTPETFSIALKLIACAQHGQEAKDPILSTRVPLPQFEGFKPDIVASPHRNDSQTSNTAATIIQPAEREKYASIFNVHHPVDGVLDAEKAKSIFLKSKLPTDTLGQIWNLADVRRSGALNQTEFVIAMHYIAKLMDGTLSVLPTQLPPSVYASAGGNPVPSPVVRQSSAEFTSSPAFLPRQLSGQHPAHTPTIARQMTGMMTPPQRSQTIDSLGTMAFGSAAAMDTPTQWDVSAQEKAQFDAFFDKIDTQRTGFMQGKDAVEFFKNSRLPEADLAHIWDLADMQQRGRLSRNEFAVAMHLIHKRLRGEALPSSLPQSLIPPSPHVPFMPSPSPAPARAFSGNELQRAATMAARPSPSSLTVDPFNPSSSRGTSLMDDQDLLGDFGNNEQLTQETNQVNQMQNQMADLRRATGEVKTQKLTAEQTLEQLAKQKQELQAQMAQVRLAHETEVKDLNELQEKLRQEEPAFVQVRDEHDAAQRELLEVQNQIAQLKQTLENGRAESESLRHRVHDIQVETTQLVQELEDLRSQVKQQGMMLDINRRQVTASEQDRDQAKRDLDEFKEVHAIQENMNKQPDHQGRTSSTGMETHASEIAGATPATASPAPALPTSPSASQTLPQRQDQQPSPSLFASPFGNPSEPSTGSNDFFDIFSPKMEVAEAKALENETKEPAIKSQIETPKEESRTSSDEGSSSSQSGSSSAGTESAQSTENKEPQSTTASGGGAAAAMDDFDAIFGTFTTNDAVAPSEPTHGGHSGSSENHPPATDGFDPIHHQQKEDAKGPTSEDKDSVSEYESPASTPGRTARQAPPPPPPPQSRHHHRQSSETKAAAAMTTQKKQRAPPPPPPAAPAPAPANASAAASSSTPTPAQKPNEEPMEDAEDDFEKAFSKELNDVKIVDKAHEHDFDDFDDAFSAFDLPKEPTVPKPEAASSASPASPSKTNWASSFGGFNFPDFGSSSTATKITSSATPATSNKMKDEDDWDSIFGGPGTSKGTNQGTSDNSNNNNASIPIGFDDAFSSFDDVQESVNEKKESSVKGDNKIEELVKMGFNRQNAKEALDRYDQDLTKATNFLLDQSSN